VHILTKALAPCARRCARLLCLLPFVVASAVAHAAPAVTESPPDALLTIDQNRSTVVDRIVADWGDALARSNAGIDRAQLRQILERMRADHLLAASLAGSLEGLRKVVEGALGSSRDRIGSEARVDPRALGDTGADVVYTPVTPCRLVETRGTFPAVYQGDGTAAHGPVPFASGNVRAYTLQGGNAVCLSQLPPGLNPSAVQLQVFALPIGNTSSGDVEILPQGATFGNTATLVFLANLAVVSGSATVRANLANNQIAVQIRGGTGVHLALDVVGYFAPPATTSLQCITVPGPSKAIDVSSDTLVPLPSCTTGYTRTGSACTGTAGVPGGYLLETSLAGCLFRNLSSVTTYNAGAASICCRVPGR
jgi:hypothetical protein